MQLKTVFFKNSFCDHFIAFYIEKYCAILCIYILPSLLQNFSSSFKDFTMRDNCLNSVSSFSWVTKLNKNVSKDKNVLVLQNNDSIKQWFAVVGLKFTIERRNFNNYELEKKQTRDSEFYKLCLWSANSSKELKGAYPSRDQMVILQDSARILQKLPILQDLAENCLSCKIWQKNGYLARPGRKMVILQDLPEKWLSCKTLASSFRSSCLLIGSLSCKTFHFEQKFT